MSVADLNTTVLPVTSAAATGPPASANGKLNGAITTHTPYGRITLRLCEAMPSSGSSGQRVIEAGVLFEVVGVVVEEVDRFLRFAERLHPVLADLQGQRRGDVVDALLHQVADLAQQARALGDRECAPGRDTPRARRCIAASTSAASASGNSPSTRSVSIGLCLAAQAGGFAIAPAMNSGWRWPNCASRRASAASNRSCISAGGLNIVA